MKKPKRNIIRIEYDRTGQNQEIAAYWDCEEKRPYYELEKLYSEGLGIGFEDINMTVLIPDKFTVL